jgi:hypothetical protein
MKKIEIIVPDRLFNDVNRIIRDTHPGGTTFQGRRKRKDQGKASCHCSRN